VHVARMEEMANAYHILVVEHKRKGRLERCRRRSEDNIRKDLRYIGR
jgi:dephospho-CoA kinase